MREPMLTFNLPYFKVELPSGADIIETCGEMQYSITLTGGVCATDCSAIQLTQTANNLVTSASVSIQTDDQQYALIDCLKADHLLIAEEYKKYEPPYSTEYTFRLSVVFVEYPGLDSGAFLKTQVFRVKDLCANMIFTPVDKPLMSDLNNLGNFVIDNHEDEVALGDDENSPWVYTLVKHI